MWRTKVVILHALVSCQPPPPPVFPPLKSTALGAHFNVHQYHPAQIAVSMTPLTQTPPGLAAATFQLPAVCFGTAAV